MKMTFNWVADTGYIPFLYADQLGYYKDAGIEMEFEQGRGSMVTSQLIAQGKADVGYADSGAAISVASKGGPIKIIAVINQANSYGLVSLADSGIKTPQDLIGKKIAVCPGCAQVPLLDAFMAVQHLDPAKVEIQNVQESAFAGLLTEKKIDARRAGSPDHHGALGGEGRRDPDDVFPRQWRGAGQLRADRQ